MRSHPCNMCRRTLGIECSGLGSKGKNLKWIRRIVFCVYLIYAYLKCRDVACRVSPGGNSWNYHIHLMRCAARQLGGERALEHLLQILFIYYINSKKLEEKSVPRREIAIPRRGMAVSRRGIAISRRGMQKYTIFSWFCSCYLAPSPVSRNSYDVIIYI